MGTAQDPADEPADEMRPTSSTRRSGGVAVESGEALAETVDRASLEPRAPIDENLLAPGTMLPPSYRVERVLGRGGMGVVYLVEHVDLERRFAAKVVAHGVNEDHLARLRKEARVASAIRHPNIVDVVHLGRREDGSFFVVMEFLEGEDLGTRMERRWKESPEAPWLPSEEIRTYTSQMFSGLAAAHAAGVIHRDLKPDNVFLTTVGGERVVKLVDFGIAKAAEVGRDHGLTRTGQIIGTPLYMAPEQTRSTSDVDVRADLYSMGVILYEMAAGALPFEAETVFDLIVQHATKPPTPPRVHRPDLPEAVEAVILRCLEKHRDDRFANVEELARAWSEAWEASPVALETAASEGAEAPALDASGAADDADTGATHELGVPARAGRVGSAHPEAGPEASPAVSPELPSVEAKGAATRPANRPRMGLAALAVLVVAGGAWWAFGRGNPTPVTPTPMAEPAHAEPPPTEPTPSEPTPSEPSAEVAPVAPATRLVTSEPPGAEVTRDGTVLGTTPLDVDVPIDDAAEIVVQAGGYEPSTVTLEPNDTAELRLELTQLARAGRTGRHAGPRTPAQSAGQSETVAHPPTPAHPPRNSGGILLGMDEFDAERGSH